MKRALVGGLVLLIVIVLAAVLIGPRLVDVERYRPRIEAAIGEATGWEAELGAMHLSLLPSARLRVNPVRLTDPASGAEAEVGELSVRAELWPLVHGRLEVRRVDLLRPRITLHETPAGVPIPVLPAAKEASPGTDSGERQSPVAVTVGTVRLRGGSITVEPATAGQPAWALSRVDADLDPATGGVEGSASLPGGGRLSWRGTAGKTLDMDLENVATEALPPWLADGLLRPGGTIDGRVTISGADRVEGEIDGENILLAAGETPLAAAHATFALAGGGAGWRLEKLQLSSGPVRLTGSGPLTPATSLALKIVDAPVEAALAAARAAFPVPLQATGPGTLAATVSFRRPANGEAVIEADGEISAARFVAAEGLPALAGVVSRFRLRPDGALEVPSLAAELAGGKVSGGARLDRVDPPGRLTVEGSLEGASIPDLLGAFAVPGGDRISGTLDGKLRIAVDLSRAELGPAALSGTVSVAANRLTLPGWNLIGAVRSEIDRQGSLTDALTSVALRRLAGGKAAAEGASQAEGEATFDEARATLDLDTAPWKLTELKLASPDLTAAGTGTVDPAAGVVRLDLTALLPAATSAVLARKAGALKRLLDADGRMVLPLAVRGPLAGPSVGVDLGRALTGGKPTDKGPAGVLDGLLDALGKRKK